MTTSLPSNHTNKQYFTIMKYMFLFLLMYCGMYFYHIFHYVFLNSSPRKYGSFYVSASVQQTSTRNSWDYFGSRQVEVEEPHQQVFVPPVTTSENDDVCSDGGGIVLSEEDEDPMLKPMPTAYDPNFKAYVRADVSSFYQEPPGSRVEYTPEFKGHAGKFINISPLTLNLFWDDGANGHYIATVGPWEAGGTASHPHHRFYFARSDTEEVVCQFMVSLDNAIYYFDPFTTPQNDDYVQRNPSSRGTHVVAANTEQEQPLFSFSTLTIEEQKLYNAHRYNLHFGIKYKNFTGGSEWLTMYPKSPPKHKLWRADYLGQQHHIQTKQTQFIQLPPKSITAKRSTTSIGEQILKEYRTPGDSMNITITALSVAPRAFEIENFLSDVEVDHILELVKARGIQRSTVGGGFSSTQPKRSNVRTSKNTWIPRTSSIILDVIYRRVADVLRLDEALLRRRKSYEIVSGPYENVTSVRTTSISEDLQIVHYDVGEQYTAHHDFGYPKKKNEDHIYPSRSINLCMYLNEGMEGGQTSFPRWRNGHTNSSLNVTPKKGKAMIFYMVHPDGNLDDLTQHAALPIVDGEKWFANLWIWDPYKP